MIVRRIKPEELKRAVQMSALAFEYRMGNSELSAQELVDQRLFVFDFGAADDDEERMMRIFCDLI